MSDLKSKLPDLKELTEMTGKLFNDVKKSITEIAHTYQEKRKEVESEPEKAEAPKTKKSAHEEKSDTKEEPPKE